MIRKHFVFHGDVQGVGFRFTAEQLAYKYELTGWVYNDYDGSVVMELQGEKRNIEKVLNGLNKGTFINITDIEEKEMALDDYEHSFTVRFV